ncbi:MAG: NERD domain-containing protein [Clostridia bacterium]|nr:NERD domain-containing protein [Clostridia bacterium]
MSNIIYNFPLQKMTVYDKMFYVKTRWRYAMEVFLIILLILAICAVISAIAYYVYKFVSRVKSSRQLLYGDESERNIRHALITRFGKCRVLSGVYLPYINDPLGRYAEVDDIVITGGGIVVVEVKSHNGKIDNRSESIWIQHYGDKVVKFQNPVLQNAVHVRVVSDILRKEGIIDVPVYNLVVFTSKNVAFAKKVREVCSQKTMASRLSSIESDRVLSIIDRRNIKLLLGEYAEKSKRVQKKHLQDIKRMH